MRILADLRACEPWIGARLCGGVRGIPLRRPYARLGAPGLALVGDSGCMVYSAHGSGVGMGLIAGRLLAEAVVAHDDPGCAEALWAYQARFLRTYGPRLGAMDVIRRLFQSGSGDDSERLLTAGFLAEEATATGLAQREPIPTARDTAALLGACVRAPRVAARVLRWSVRVAAVMAIYRRHPALPDERRHGAWVVAAAHAAGVPPDPG